MLETFKAWDKDGSGSITKEELQEVFTRLGCKISASELGKVLKDADADKDSKISYEEFLGPMSHRRTMIMTIMATKSNSSDDHNTQSHISYLPPLAGRFVAWLCRAPHLEHYFKARRKSLFQLLAAFSSF